MRRGARFHSITLSKKKMVITDAWKNVIIRVDDSLFLRHYW